MSVHEATVLVCDDPVCDRALVPTGDAASSRAGAREFARAHGWATADQHPAWVDLCPAHSAAMSTPHSRTKLTQR